MRSFSACGPAGRIRPWTPAEKWRIMSIDDICNLFLQTRRRPPAPEKRRLPFCGGRGHAFPHRLCVHVVDGERAPGLFSVRNMRHGRPWSDVPQARPPFFSLRGSVTWKNIPILSTLPSRLRTSCRLFRIPRRPSFLRKTGSFFFSPPPRRTGAGFPPGRGAGLPRRFLPCSPRISIFW